jgi:hypothetical protein
VRLRPTALAAVLALSTTSVALGVVSCGSEAFTSNYASGGEAGMSATGGSSGTSGTSGTSGASGTTGTSGDGAGAQAGEAGRSGGDGGASAQGGASAGGSAGDTGMTGGEGGEAGGGAPCDPLLSPGEDACVIDDVYAVFVSPAGSDDEGDGTKASPFESFAKAIESAALNDKRVFACADGGVFGERVSIDAEANGVEIYGGFSCDDWTYDATAKTSVVSPTPLALHIVEADDVTIEGFRFEAADGSLPGESSVGAFVVNSTGVVLRRVEIVAGDGVKGADGGLVEFEYPEKELLNGNPESPALCGGGPKVCACQGVLVSAGGGGGSPNLAGQPGASGLPAFMAGQGGMVAECGAGGTGVGGANAPHAAAAPGAEILGAATSAGWQPASGGDGATGQPGQGGGGGASLNDQGHGGGGACGGCGGNGATKGFGGGASISLLVFESELDIEAASLIAGSAGDGGNGHVGQSAQTERGSGGGVVDSNNSCPGGGGGLGGNGGASGGGAGGISVGIVWSGENEPTRDEVTFAVDTPGDGGLGGEPGVNDGISGIAQDLLEVM